MWMTVLKVLISAVVLVAVSEIAKRSTVWAAGLESLPLTSLLAIVWMHLDGQPAERIASVSSDIFWLVLPSLLLFVALPWLLRIGWGFWPALGASCAITVAAYAGMLWWLQRFEPA